MGDLPYAGTIRERGFGVKGKGYGENNLILYLIMIIFDQYYREQMTRIKEDKKWH
jgi:hypothetical protein